MATAAASVTPWRAVAVRGALAAALCAAASSGAVAETYSVEQLGLTGEGYTNTSSGFAYSSATALNQAGQVFGLSNRFNGTTFTGQAAWLYSQGVTQQIGLTGAGYSTSSGYAISEARALNEAGQLVGFSQRYSGTTYTGQAVWLFNQGVTQQVGLTGVGYTNTSSGFAYSVVTALNEAGQVIGYSSRYNGTTGTGQAAWLYSQGVTQQVGLTGAGYTDSSSGYANSEATALNEAGQVIGSSTRFNGTTRTGQAAWLYSQGVTQQIGLTGAGYTDSSSGAAVSSARALNEAGQVIGSSRRYNGVNSYTGESAWLYSQGVTQQIGLTGAGYTNTSSGYAYSVVTALNEAGQVIGYSSRYNGTTGTGQAAWLYSQGVTQQIGLTGAGYTNTSSGYADSYARALNEASQVIGYSSRYNGTTSTGRAAWLYSQGVTQQIGLTGVGYTDTSGYAYSDVTALNEAGQVIGYSSRYNGVTGTGQTAWFFDDDLNQTFSLEFSVSSTDGYAYSEASFLGEDGLVLGSFVPYSGAASGRRAFAWTVEDGMQDLGLLIEGGLEPDWTSLASAYRGNAAGQIIGYGSLASGGQGAFLLTPVPEPDSWALLLAGLGLTGWVARHRSMVSAGILRFA